jgi:CheY-like chemotaxis protein
MMIEISMLVVCAPGRSARLGGGVTTRAPRVCTAARGVALTVCGLMVDRERGNSQNYARSKSNPHAAARFGGAITHTDSGEHGATPLTVLVVEDFEDTRFLMRIELERRGYRVLEAPNGEEGVAMAAREQPDIILMDIGLPVMDGIEATRRIRAQDGTRDVLIVALTAHHETEYRKNALAAGCDAYLTKPIDFDWLIDLLGRLLP